MRLINVYDGTRIRAQALQFLYELLQERDAAHAISHREMPTFEQHRAFVSRRPYRAWYLITTDHGPYFWAGSIYLTERDEIGVFIKRGSQGMGLGPSAITALMRRHKPAPLVNAAATYRPFLANIHPANERSKRTFERLGFRKISETYAYFEEEHRGPETEKG